MEMYSLEKDTKDSLGDRIKRYESVNDLRLPGRMPYIIRVDGAAFHTLTRGLVKPWDNRFMDAMLYTAYSLCVECQGVKLAYVQSDEISLLLTDYENIETQAWLDKRVQKLVSHSAGIASTAFQKAFKSDLERFDSRTFVLPKEEVCNYFIWRQQDATRNSIQGLAQYHFSHNSLHGLNGSQLQEKLFAEKNVNWNNLFTPFKRGMVIRRRTNIDTNLVLPEIKAKFDTDSIEHGGSIRFPFTHENIKYVDWLIDLDIPIFTQDRNYIERYV